MEDFKHDEETDDVYTMTAVIKDKAGNETKKRLCSQLTVSDQTIFSLRQRRSSLMMYMRTNRKICCYRGERRFTCVQRYLLRLDGTKKN